jgi:hypothetical protein
MTSQDRFTTVQIDTREIHSWSSFHSVFQKKMGFPDFYGKNMNAWIDCMTSADEPGDGMSTVHAPPDGVLVISLLHAKAFKKKYSELYDAIVEGVAFVNYRRMDIGERPFLVLSFYE